MNMKNEKIILASQSPRRKQLLEMAEIDFEIISEETDESFPAHLNIEDAAVHIALQKALAIQIKHPDRKIIAADTVVVLDNQIIGKPKDQADAVATLTRLSGKTHQVITGVVILDNKNQIQFADKTLVTFHHISPEQIEYYVATYKPYDKAGAYAIQEWIGAIAISRIEGCFYNVMGLPVSRIIPFL